MKKAVVTALIALLGVATVSAQSRVRCTGGISFVADPEDLCRYHWCVGTEEPVQMRCAPGSRVATWFESTTNTQDTPCTESHQDDVTCLRCDYSPDPRPVDTDRCSSNPCPAECECQNHWDNHFCLCPGNVVPTFDPVDRVTEFCRPNPCQNGAICHSQWDDYWCECPRGYTGKNCETPFCGPDTCLNGGTCTVDEINYHCECALCFAGPCCENQIGNGRDCTPIAPPGIFPPPNPTTEPPTTEPPTTTQRVTTPIIVDCDDCHYGPNCEYTRQSLCECNPCSSGQVCVDQRGSIERVCVGKPGPYGSQYTLTFSQDAAGGSRYKRVYVNVGGATIEGSHEVRIYTPNLEPSDRCYVEITVTISINNPAFYDVPADCLNTESGDVENRQILKVLHLQGQEIVVTVTNMDGDGYLAVPDSRAGMHFISHSYDKSGYIQFITVVALEDDTQVLIQQPDQEIFDFGGSNSAVEESANVITYSMNALDSVRFVYNEGDLYGNLIVSNKNIHVWTGNFGRVTQKSQEQLVAVNRWGPSGTNTYVYIIVGIADGIRNTRDEVHMETAVFTEYVLKRVNADGVKEDVSRGSAAAQSVVILGQLREGEVFELVTSWPAQVTHSIVGEVDGFSFYSSYALIPCMQQYAQAYSFQTHGWNKFVADNTPKTYSMITDDVIDRDDSMIHYLTLVAEGDSRNGLSSYLEQIVIYKYNVLSGRPETHIPSRFGLWVLVRDTYSAIRVLLPGPGAYYISNPSVEDYAFSAIYYAVSGRAVSEQPNTAFPVGFRLDQVNDIRPPVICGRCTTGPDCQIAVLSTCACNPCENFDDVCEDAKVPDGVRVCTSIVDTTGNPFTLMFMQNRPDNTDKRELEIYVTTAGSNGGLVRVFTPFLERGDACYLDMERRIPGMDVALFTVPNPGCYETIGSGTFKDKAIRVQSDNGDILVYAVNRDEFSADGWVAFPDGAAGTEFFAVCHSPAVYGTEFAVLNMQDSPVTVTLTYMAGASPDLSGTRFVLQPGEVLQVQSQNAKSDLSGTRIQSDRPVNVYSGNIRAKVDFVEDPAVGDINTGSRDHLVEQLMPVASWGSTFNIVPIPDRRFGDQLKMIGSEDGTACSMLRRDPSGRITEEQFSIGRGGIFTRDVLSDNSYRVVCDRRVFVSQITKSQERGFNIHDPSLITVPPVEQYANRYTFNTPSFSGGTGTKRPYRFRLLLISARDEDRDGILIIHRTPDGSLTTRRVSDMGTWVPVPGSDYYNIVAEIEVGSSRVVHRRDEVNFMCIFYGYDDRESLGFPIRMKLQKKEAAELLSFNSPPPRA